MPNAPRFDVPADATGIVVVCPTSHLDWNWIDTFEEYAQIGPEPNGFNGPTDQVLGQVVSLLQQDAGFRFSLAEVGYLRRFIGANPEALTVLRAAGASRFLLMGGGITSPDSLVCHGEVFIRNYLLGRRWLRGVGLHGNLGPIAWLPDDFGHDPQLPVVLAAMGLEGVGLSRVQGSPQPTPCAAPIGGGPSLATTLGETGLVFSWRAADGSVVTTHFMPDTYGAVFYGSSGAAGLASFITGFPSGWPSVDGRSWRFAPVGGDFALPSFPGGDWPEVIASYNETYFPKTKVWAIPGTFADFLAGAAASGALSTQTPLLAQNYWTGFFASRPRLKRGHERAARTLLAAEAASALLRATSIYSAAALDRLDAVIDQGWQALVPSSHHDFITGTSPDRVYWSEQLPLLELAVETAEGALRRGVAQIAGAVQAQPRTGEVPVLIYNPLGFARPAGALARLSASDVPAGVMGVRAGPGLHPIQHLANGDLLLPVQAVPGFGYVTVYLQAGRERPPDPLPDVQDVVVLDNEWLAARISRSAGWAITSLEDKRTGTELIPPGGLYNQLRVYSDSGNLYQFGNEVLGCSGGGGGGTAQFGTFALQAGQASGGEGIWRDHGPLCQHFEATVSLAGQTWTVEYLLYLDEPMIRMRFTGAAPGASSVVVAFSLVPSTDASSVTLTYGTANHWDDHQPTPYWSGPTFRATHDFVLPIGADDRTLAALYHGGIPAWSIDPDGNLLGVLLRDATGTQRGAAGTDTNRHVQEYALRLPGVGGASTGQPLREALAFNAPLIATRVTTRQQQVSLPVEASLAEVTGSRAILRAARTQDASTTYVGETWPKQQQASVVLRLYHPGFDPTAPEPVTVTLPFLAAGATFSAEVVTALEESLPDGPPVTIEGNTLTFTPRGALSTVRVTLTRPATVPNDGR